MVKITNKCYQKKCLIRSVTGTGHENSGYDFPSKSCVNNLLLNSEREDSVASMALYADRWLEEAKKSVRKSGIIITAISGLLVFLFIINMVSAIYGISDMLKQ